MAVSMLHIHVPVPSNTTNIHFPLRVYVMNINDYSWANYTIRLFIAGFFDSFICTIIYLAAIVGSVVFLKELV